MLRIADERRCPLQTDRTRRGSTARMASDLSTPYRHNCMNPPSTTLSEVVPGRIRLNAGGGASADITHHGGQVLSWVGGGKERLFVSPRAAFKAGQPIRGGIPVIFPQFADGGTGLRHGFARLMDWEPLPRGETRIAGPAEARFALVANEYTLQTWPHLFRAELIVNLTPDQLSVALRIENLDRRDFAFTAALHTYLRVSNVGTVSLSGLGNHPYIDSANGGRRHIDPDGPLRFDGEIDRVYPAASGELLLRDGSDTLRIRSHGFPDTVVWNPGRTLAAGMSDLGADQSAHFACVESGVVSAPCVVAAGATWQAAQSLSIVS